MGLSHLEIFRKINNICIQCGIALTGHDIKNGYIRCSYCRAGRAEKHRQYMQQYRSAIRNSERVLRKADSRSASKHSEHIVDKSVMKCAACVFSQIHDNVVFCQSSHGSCLKEEINRVMSHSDDRRPVSSGAYCNTDDSGMHLDREGSVNA